jgi:putative ABC transport system permease protein
MVDLYGLAAGSHATLPIRDPRTAEPTQVWVAGVFRDYGRQHGAVVMASEDYERLTGDLGKSALSVWVVPGHSVDGVLAQIRALGGVFGQASLISAESLRALSLQIFDRSFALTYALELAALIIAVFAVASGLTAQIIVRRKEFAVLAQMGQSLTQRMALVAREALGLLVLAVAWGCLLGLVMSQILIHRVNPQSFHWTMETSLPVLMTLALAGAVVATGLSAALWSSARLLQQRLLTPALREDW